MTFGAGHVVKGRAALNGHSQAMRIAECLAERWIGSGGHLACQELQLDPALPQRKRSGEGQCAWHQISRCDGEPFREHVPIKCEGEGSVTDCSAGEDGAQGGGIVIAQGTGEPLRPRLEVGCLAKILRQMTDAAFKEGEHAV